VTRDTEGDLDRIIMRRIFRDRQTGVCVDVGAARPDFLSVSALYRSLGWHVIAVEPNPEFCELHRAAGHEIYQYACGDHDEDDVSFYVIDSHGHRYEGGEVSYESFSSLGIKEEYRNLKRNLDKREIKVSLRRLDTILELHAPDVNHIDLLSVDVEGWELEVLAGLNLEKYRPSVMVIENLFDDPKYKTYVERFGYVEWKRVRPNHVYLNESLIGSGLSRFLFDLERKTGVPLPSWLTQP